MALAPEIQAAIDAIDQKIAKLRQAKALLLSEFSSNGSTEVIEREVIKRDDPHRVALQISGPARRHQPVTGEGSSSVSGLTRKAQIRDFLLQHGPTRRREIVEKTGIPEGTVSYVLNDETVFRHIEKTGKWDVISELREKAKEGQGGLLETKP